jgi:hypothetical protein
MRLKFVFLQTQSQNFTDKGCTSVDTIGVKSSNEWQQIEVLAFGDELSVFFELTVQLLSGSLSKHPGLKNSPMLKLKYENNHILKGPQENSTA